ncbi:MAG: uncharacterized protein QOH06_4112 [Acidobacteriota bacterium]|nr:uncharacterized protein [Acidobacteriota bacterium]
MATAKTLSSIPFQGSGLGYRNELKKSVWEHRSEIDCLEVITDRYIENPHLTSELEELCDSFRVIPHGVCLSIGSPDLDFEYLRGVRRVCEITKTPYYSEHLCMTRAPGIEIGHLAPLWFTDEALAVTIDNVHRVQDFLGMPLILENTTYPFEIPGADMSQTEFFHRLVGATECGVLLDIANIRINSANHGFDPVSFLDQMPLEYVVQLHMSGGFEDNRGELIDGHCRTPDEAIWSLLEELAVRAPHVQGSILEHDASFPEDFSDLMSTVTRTRRTLDWVPSAKSADSRPRYAAVAGG